MKLLKRLAWVLVAFAGALGLGMIATTRGEPLNAVWLVAAAACIYAIGYRFYSRFVALRVLELNDQRATPAERLEDGHDFVPTNKWVVFGHHFAAIAGPGPLVGPILAAQFGYLPGTLWIVLGGVLGGCVQDFVTLFCSIRRDGKSLGQMAKEEISELGGWTALFGVLFIMVILIAVVALVIVNALKASPWGLFTIAMTIPIALLLGIYLRYLRPGRVMEASALGFTLVMIAVIVGRYVAESPALARYDQASGVATVRPFTSLKIDNTYLFSRLRTGGAIVNGQAFSADFQGGLYSMSGFYPGSTVQAMIANDVLTLVNKTYGSSYGLINLDTMAGSDPNFRVTANRFHPRRPGPEVTR